MKTVGAPDSQLPVTIFVVSLLRAQDRWDLLEPVLKTLNQSWRRVEAYDAKTDRDSILAMRGLRLANDPEHPDRIDPKLVKWQNLAVSEEACFLSHIAAMRSFMESGQTYGLIIEDDAVLPPNLFAEGGPIAQCLEKSEYWDVVRLEGSKSRGERLSFVYGESGENRLVASMMPSSNAGAYLVSRKGAQLLVERGATVIEPFDTFLVDVGRSRARVLDFSPYPIWQQIWQQNAPSYNTITPKGRDVRSRLGRALPKLRRHLTRLIWFSARGLIDRKPLRKCRWRN